MSNPNQAGHHFSGKTCIECGLTRHEAALQGGRCTGLDLDDEGYHVLARPLAMVPVGDPGDDLLGAYLVSADDPPMPAARTVAPADTFNPDGAFRALDDLRARAEIVLGWVEESLSTAPSPRPAKRKLPAWTVPWLATGALAVAVLLAPASFIVELGQWAYWAVTLLAAAWATHRSVSRLASIDAPIGCVAGLGIVFLSVVVALVCVLFMSDSTYVAAHRLLLALVGAFPFHKAYNWHRNRAAERDAPRRPTEHRTRDYEEGVPEPAAHFRPELILMDGNLHAAIEGYAEDGRVLRLLTLVVNTATREYADEMVRMAREGNDEITRLRDTELEKEAASAAALQRLEELERVRRSLPNG